MRPYEFVRMMEEKKVERIEDSIRFKPRDIYYEIIRRIERFRDRRDKTLFIFHGLRGIGKSIALNQAMAKHDGMFIDGTILSYYDLDPLEIVREYLLNNKYDILYIDELTDIKNWDKFLKIIYDNFRIKVIATGSSAIKIFTKHSQVGRRAELVELPPLTFKEYLRLKHDLVIEQSSRDLFTSKPSEAYSKAKSLLMDLPNLVGEFREYMKEGFPLAFERNIEEVSESVIMKILVDDFPEISGFNLDVVNKAKRMIDLIALSKPGVISLSKFTNVADCSKTTASNILEALSISSLVIGIPPVASSTAKLRKERKYLFSSSALRYGVETRFVDRVDIGSLREDAVVSSLYYNGFNVEFFRTGSKPTPDYMISYKGVKNTIEVGGSSKDLDQLAKSKGILLLDADSVDYSKGVVTLPLYLVGLL